MRVHVLRSRKIFLCCLLFVGSCQENEFERQLIVSTKVYGGDKVMNPTFTGEILDLGTSPIVHHGFVWGENEDPDLTSPNVIDLGARESKGTFTSLIPELFQNTTYYIRAYATNTKGKTAFGKSIAYKTPQQTTPLSATSGGSGTIIIIAGVFEFNTTAEIKVFFGSYEATILLATSTIIQVIVPEGIPPGDVKISIKILDKDPQFVPDDFTVLEAPVIESLAPARGAVGSTVTIRGRNFIETAPFNTVFFDSIPAAVISATPTELVTKVPSGVEQGEVSVTVKSGGLRTALARKFSTQQEPTVTGYTPQTAPVGARLTITGKNLGTDIINTRVLFGEVAGTVAFVSDSLISVNVPTGINVGANIPIKLTANGSTLTLTPNFVVKAEGTAAVTVATAINANTTWGKVAGPGEVDYRVTADVTVTQELTVGPGVIVEFENGKSLTFSGATSALIAKGTAAKPIVFTGKEKVKGSWRRIQFFESNNSRNELDFVEVSYGGDGVSMVDTYSISGVKLRITNSIFSHSKSSAMAITGSATLDAFSNNTFHNNELSPLVIPAREVGKLAANNRFTGNNGRNAVEVVGSTINAFAETVWNAFTDGSPYYISGNITVNSGMKVMPGATLTFNLNTNLIISGAAAYLTANGTSTQKIVFTGADQTFKGSWDKLYIANTLSPKNQLDHVEISYGGSNSASPNCLQTLNSLVKITNSVISNSLGTGAYFDGSTLTLGFNTFAHNTLYPISIEVDQIRNMDSNSTYVNNGTNKVNVFGSTLNDPVNEHVWKPLGNDVPYLVSGNVSVRTGVSIQPGAVFEFMETRYFTIDGGNTDAYLIAKGTEEKPILFTGATKTRGSWNKIHFYASENPKNEFDFVEISYAGSVEECVWVDDGSRLKITNSTIRESGHNGVYVDDQLGSEFTAFSNNKFLENNFVPLSIPVHQIGNLDANSEFLNNGTNAVEVRGSSVNETVEQVWPALSNGTPYFVSGNITINSGVSIQPGAIFTFAGLAGIQVGSSCCTASPSPYLIAKGTASKKIIFTGLDQTSKGSWNRITFYYTNSQRSELDYVDISYGSDASLNIDDSNIKITHTTISNSSGNGLYVDDNSSLLAFADNTFTGNNAYPLVVSADQIGKLDSNSKFNGNTFNKINIYGSSVNIPAVEQVWPAIADGTNYYVSGNVVIQSGVSIQPGAIFTFAVNTGIQIGSSCCTATPNSYLSAKGTASQKIVFTGADQTYKGSWNRLTFYYTISLKNELDFVDISYGSDASLNIDNSYIKLTNSAMSNSSGNGLYMDDASTLLSFAENTFSNNNAYPLVLSVDQLGKLDSNSKFASNTFNKINIYSSTVNIPAIEQVWPAIADGTNYYFSGDIVIASGVSIQAGAIFSFAGNAGLQIGSSCCTPTIASYLIARGTSSEPITFTRDAGEVNNYWDGITFYYTSNAINELDNVIISYGSNGVYVTTSSAKITNSSISNCLNYGINRYNGTLNSDVKTSNTFSNNGLGDTNF